MTPPLTLQTKRMELASKLWSAGLKAEFGFKPNPKMGDQLGHALEAGIPFMVLFGEEELAAGAVKVGGHMYSAVTWRSWRRV